MIESRNRKYIQPRSGAAKTQKAVIPVGLIASREPPFVHADILRTHPELGECFAMLTSQPGLDIAPHHDRQIVVVPPKDWARWLDPHHPAADLLKPAPAGSIEVVRGR